jgi:hypothetical protein
MMGLDSQRKPKMSVRVLDYYRVKPEFMPPHLQLLGVYVLPGELETHFDPTQWDLVGRTFHPNRPQAADVERQGFCMRELGFDVKGRARSRYRP